MEAVDSWGNYAIGVLEANVTHCMANEAPEYKLYLPLIMKAAEPD